jgi:hypothetical protein
MRPITSSFIVSLALAGFAVLSVASFALSTPAFALGFSEAEKLCKKNPNCTAIANTRDRDGGGGFCIKTSKGTCSHYVDCTKDKCIKAYIEPGGARKPVGGDVRPILTGRPGQALSTASNSPPKPSSRVTGQGVLGGGLLDSGSGWGTRGPAATGSPLSTGGKSSPPPGKIY